MQRLQLIKQIRKKKIKSKLRKEARIIARDLQRICIKCGEKENLTIHHKDHNRYDNSLENLEILCRECHDVMHGIQKRFRHRKI